jgi:tetratricopeptide (TPR) repeat protein
MGNRIRLIATVCVIFLTPLAFSQSAARLFSEAKAAQAAGNRDVAFLLYRQIIREYPESAYVEESHFEVGQYYYDTRNYFDASQTLREFLGKYPSSRFGGEARDHLTKMRLLSLKDRADRLFEEGKLGPASVLYQQYLQIDKDNPEVRAQLEQLTEIQKEVHFGFEQLNRERKNLEQERSALKEQIADLETQRKQVTALRKQALEMNQETVKNYEKKLGAVTERVESLRTLGARLEEEVKEWRQRAVRVEAARLSRPLQRGLRPVPEQTNLPRIAFEGGKADPAPEEGESQVMGILRQGFPAAVVTNAGVDAKTSLRHVEAVVSVVLTSPWPEGVKMKFRVDFIARRGQPAPDPQFLIRYFDSSDMDEFDETTKSYRKRVLFTAEENKVERCEISAFLVKTK